MQQMTTTFALELLNPRSPFQFAWKVLFWCVFTTVLALLAEIILGTEISNPLPTYFGIVVIIAAPSFSLGMFLVKRMLSLQDELLHMASTDILTGLNNRRAFFDNVGDPASGQIVLLDIDHFKKINDTYGHAAGDMVLVEISDHMKREFSSLGFLARVGGEEFAIFSKADDAGELLKAVRKLVKGVQVDLDAVSVDVTLSAGWSRSGEHVPSAELMKQADEALYRAKSAGRACIRKWRNE